MRKKIKLILTTLFITAVVIASIIEIGKILNISESNIEYNDFKKSTATAGPPDSFTAGSLSGANTNAMYSFIPDHMHYCGGHGWALTLRKFYLPNSYPIVPDRGGAGRKEEVTYEKAKTVEMAQSVAYGMAFRNKNNNDLAMQHLIWSSRTWKDYTNGCCLVEESDSYTVYTWSSGLEGRATQFANFVYRALNDNRKIKFMVNSNRRK